MEAQWLDDPTTRMRYRWWDGSAFTVYVSNDGRSQSLDPVGLELITAYPVTMNPEALPSGATPVRPASAVWSDAPTSSDSIGYFLGIAGWILLGLSILGGIVIAGNASSDYDSTVSPAGLPRGEVTVGSQAAVAV